MNIFTLLRKLIINITLVLSILTVSACSSSEDNADKFYTNGMQLLEKNELVKANIEFRNALQFNRKMTKAIWGQVLVAEKQGKPREQYKHLNAVLVNEPENLQAIVKLGRLLLLAGQLDKSLVKSEQAMKIDEHDHSALSLRAAVLLKLEDVDGAVALANKILMKDPVYIDALMILATERMKTGNTQKAIEYIERGLTKEPKNIGLQLFKIKALESINKVQLAEGVLKKLINYYPNTAAFKHMLAQFYLKQNSGDKAEKIYRTIVENNPGDLKAKFKLVHFLNRIKGTDAGIKQLHEFIKENPANVDLKFALVQLYVARKEVILANKLLEKIASEKYDSKTTIKAKGIMAALLLEKGNKISAEKIINEILANDKQNINGLILKSTLDIERQEYDKAISNLRLVLGDVPNSSRAQFYLAKAYNLSGSPHLADEQYYKAFKSSKFNETYGLKYAQFLLKRKQVARAEKVLEDILSISKTSLNALKLLAQIRLSSGDWLGAQEVADVIKRIDDKSNLSSQINNAVLVGKKEYSESIELLKKTYQSTPGDIRPVVSLVRTYLLAGKTEEAGNFLDAVISTNPKNTSARILKGRLYSSQGKTEQAIKVYQEALKHDPDKVISYYYLAVIYLQEKNYGKARDILNKGLMVAPKSFPLSLTSAQMYELTGQFEKAIKVYEELLQERPNADIVANNLASLLTEYRMDNESFEKAYAISKRFKQSEVPQFKDTFGWASYRLGKYNDAQLLFESVVKQMPDSPDFHYHLGMNYLANKEISRARQELEKALKLAGDKSFNKSEQIRAALEKL